MIRFSSINSSKNQKWAKNEFDNLLKLSYFMDLYGDYKGSEKTYNIANSISKFIKLAQPDDIDSSEEETEKPEEATEEELFTPNTEPITPENISDLSDKSFADLGLAPVDTHSSLQSKTELLRSHEYFNDKDEYFNILNLMIRCLALGGTDIKKSLSSLQRIIKLLEEQTWVYDADIFPIIKVALSRYYNNPYFLRQRFDLSNYDFNIIYDDIHSGTISDKTVEWIKRLLNSKTQAQKKFESVYNQTSNILTNLNYQPNPRLIKIILKTLGWNAITFEDDVKQNVDIFIAGMEFTDNDVLVKPVGELVLSSSRDYVIKILKLLGIDKFTRFEELNQAETNIKILSKYNHNFVDKAEEEKYKPFISEVSLLLKNTKIKDRLIQIPIEYLKTIVGIITPQKFVEDLLNFQGYYDSDYVKNLYKSINQSTIDEITKLCETKGITVKTIPDIVVQAYNSKGEKGFDLLYTFFGNSLFNRQRLEGHLVDPFSIYAPIDKFLEWLEIQKKGRYDYSSDEIEDFDTCYKICPELINSFNTKDLNCISETYDDYGEVKKIEVPVFCQDIIKLKQFGIESQIIRRNRNLAQVDTETLQKLLDKYGDQKVLNAVLVNHSNEICVFGDVNEDWEKVLETYSDISIKWHKRAIQEAAKLGYTITDLNNVYWDFKYGIFKAMIITYLPNYNDIKGNRELIDLQMKKIDTIMESISRSKNYAHIKPYSLDYAKLVILFLNNYNIRGRDPNLLLDLYEDFENSQMFDQVFPNLPTAAITNFFGTSNLSEISPSSDKFLFLTSKSLDSQIRNFKNDGWGWMKREFRMYEDLREFKKHLIQLSADFGLNLDIDDILSSKDKILEILDKYEGDIPYASNIQNYMNDKGFFYVPLFINVDIRTYADKFLYNYIDYIKDKIDPYSQSLKPDEQEKSFFDIYTKTSYGRLKDTSIEEFLKNPENNINDLYRTNYELFLKAINLPDIKATRIKLPKQAYNKNITQVFFKPDITTYITNIIQIFGNSTKIALDKFSREWFKKINKKPKNYEDNEYGTKQTLLHDFGNILPLQIDSNIAGYAQYFFENFTSKTIDDLKLIGSSWNKVIKFYDETDINKILAEMAIKDAAKLPEYKNNSKALCDKIKLSNLSFLVTEIDNHKQYPFLLEFSKYYSSQDQQQLKNNFNFLKTIWTEGIKTPLPEFAKFNKSYKQDKDTITMRFLPREDPRGMFLGNIANCCQHPEGAAASCAFDGTFNKNAAFMVTEINDDLALMAYVWQDKDGNVCFDNFETIGDRIFHSQSIQNVVKQLLMDFAASLPEGKRTTYGIGYTKLKFGFNRTKKPLINTLNFMQNPKYTKMLEKIKKQIPYIDWYDSDSKNQIEIPRNLAQQETSQSNEHLLSDEWLGEQDDVDDDYWADPFDD